MKIDNNASPYSVLPIGMGIIQTPGYNKEQLEGNHFKTSR